MTIMSITNGSGQQVTVRVDVEGDDAHADCGGDKIGDITTASGSDLGRGHRVPPTITHMHVDEEYRRNEIGLAMIRALVAEFGILRPAEKNIGIGGLNALTDEGERLARRAQAEGLIVPFPDERAESEGDYLD